LLGISMLDWIVLVAYFLLITFLGVWTYKKIKSSADYFMGNRRFGKLLMIAQAFGVGTHTDQPVSVAGASYTNGLAGIWYQWMWMFSTPFFWIIGPIYRRLRYVTMADFFYERYGKSIAVLFALMGIVYFSMDIGLMLKGTGITLEGITGGAISETAVILVATLLFVIYGLAGGIIAAVITDLIQGILILVLSFLLIPFAINEAGGITAIHQGLPEHMFSLIAPQEVTLFFILMIVINGLVGIVVQPHHMAVGGAGKTEIACRTGWTYGNFLKRFATMGWAFTGLFGAFLYAGLTIENRELAFGIMARNLLPVGLVGLMMAALVAAVMSTCDAFMVHASALFTKNVYMQFINPNASDKQQLKVGRITAAITVVGGIGFAFVFPSVIGGLIEVWKVTAYLGVAFWVGIIWRRANRYGAWSSAITMAAISIFTDTVLGWSLPIQIAIYIPIGFIVMIVVSKLTKPEPEDKLRQFYMLLDTPVGKEDKLQRENVDIKLKGMSIGKPEEGAKKSWMERIFGGKSEDGLIIVDLMSLPKKFTWQRYRTDILGFAIATIIVIFLIALAIYLAGYGA
jgi:Na+/proline symporter